MLARKATVWARMPLKVHAHHSLDVDAYTDAGWNASQTALRKRTATLQNTLRVVARQRIKPVFDILAFESSETGGKIVICGRNSSGSRRR